MAERRMFAKSVINSARFLRMPATSRLLYYDLGMAADDDGIVEAFTVMRTTGATEDDLRVLMSKKFVTVLNEDFVTLINDWKRNNLIKRDRYRPSVYADLLVRLTDGTQVEPDWNPDGTQVEPQDRLGKDRLGEGMQGETAPSGAASRHSIDYQSIVDDYNKTCTKLPKCLKLSDARRKAIAARMKAYTLDEIHRVFEKAQASKFLTGQNDRNWMASFDWIMRDSNMAKILDGNYDDRNGGEKNAGNQYSELFSKYTI